VRLRYGYFITCTDVIKDADGNITELRCTYDPATRGGFAPDGRRVKATIHWVSAAHAVEAEARLYDHLFTVEVPDADPDRDFIELLNPQSMVVLSPIYVEPAVRDSAVGDRLQFERLAYFAIDPDSTDDKLVFNRTVTLRDDWQKIQKQESAN
jgi:glutaminyl-tRNA synthetase